jgi:hypothetical protein
MEGGPVNSGAGGDRWAAAACCVALLLAACTFDLTRSSPPPADQGPTMTPSSICDAYLACVSAAEPQSFPATLQIYRRDGPCWATAVAAAGCQEACRQKQDELAQKYPSVVECQEKSDAGPARE